MQSSYTHTHHTHTHTHRDPLLVEDAQKTDLSPSAQEISFNKTPNESSLEMIKSITVAPKNLMDVSGLCVDVEDLAECQACCKLL